MNSPNNRNQLLLTLLRQKQVKATLQRNALTRPLIIGRKARRVRRLGDLAVGDLLEGVEAVAAGVEGVHQMHDGRLVSGGELKNAGESRIWIWLLGVPIGFVRLVGFDGMKFLVMRFW